MILRTGYYNGRGARLMRTVGPLAGRTHTDPEVGRNRLRECRWEPSLELEIPETWTSGVYVGRLTTLPESTDELYWQSYVIFIVKDNRPADVLFQCSDNTWQAYNRWPDQFSLYKVVAEVHALTLIRRFIHVQPYHTLGYRPQESKKTVRILRSNSGLIAV